MNVFTLIGQFVVIMLAIIGTYKLVLLIWYTYGFMRGSLRACRLANKYDSRYSSDRSYVIAVLRGFGWAWGTLIGSKPRSTKHPKLGYLGEYYELWDQSGPAIKVVQVPHWGLHPTNPANA